MDAVVVHGRSGEAIELPVAQGPATGYSWVLELPPGVSRAPDGPAAPAPEGVLGAASGAAVRVTAAAGHYRLTARLARPWQPDTPIRTVRIDLTVE